MSVTTALLGRLKAAELGFVLLRDGCVVVQRQRLLLSQLFLFNASALLLLHVQLRVGHE